MYGSWKDTQLNSIHCTSSLSFNVTFWRLMDKLLCQYRHLSRVLPRTISSPSGQVCFGQGLWPHQSYLLPHQRNKTIEGMGVAMLKGPGENAAWCAYNSTWLDFAISLRISRWQLFIRSFISQRIRLRSIIIQLLNNGVCVCVLQDSWLCNRTISA